MSETTTVEQPVSQEQPSLAELAHLAFGDPLPAAATEAAAPAVTETPAAPVGTVAVPTETSQEEIVDDIVYLKQQLGYENWEDAKAEIEELRKLKTAPPKTEEVKFTNEESKKLYQYLREGKEDEVAKYISGRQILKDVDNKPDEDKLKLYIKLQNPLFDSELIEDEYNSLYTIDENDEKFKNAEGDTDQLKLRKEKLRIQQRIQNDAQKAQEYFSQYKTKIELPDIQPQQATVDEGYEEYKASTAKSVEVYNSVIAPAIKSLKESDVNLGISVNDESNQMKFDVAIVPEQTDFEKARQGALSVVDFLEKTCYDANGNFLPAKLQRLILLEQNFDKYAQSIARQAVNAERKRVIEKETPNNGVRRDYSVMTPEVKTELDKHAQMAFSI